MKAAEAKEIALQNTVMPKEILSLIKDAANGGLLEVKFNYLLTEREIVALELNGYSVTARGLGYNGFHYTISWR
jgi:hypothetical protein